MVSALGTDVVTKSTFLSGTSCPSPAAGFVSSAVEADPALLGLLLPGTTGLQMLRNPEKNKAQGGNQAVLQSTRGFQFRFQGKASLKLLISCLFMIPNSTETEGAEGS